MDLLTHTVRFFRQQHPLPPGSRLLLAVSGGNDSLVLLHVMAHLRDELGLRLHVASLDHGMRGAAGAADASFVREQAEELGLNVSLGQAAGLRSEADARRARHDFLADTAVSIGASHVATAHHADDQAETVLLNLLRGSGLRGLAAMQPRAPLPGHPQLTLLRPFLSIRREELRAWCRARGLTPRQDASNDDRRLLRNRLRHDVLPLLRSINPQLEGSLLRLADNSALDYDFLQRELASLMGEALYSDGQRLRLPRATFAALHPSLQRLALMNALRELGAGGTSSAHLLRLMALALNGRTGQRHTLPGSVQLRLDHDDLVFEHRDAAEEWPGPLLNSDGPLAVACPGMTPLPDSDWQLVIGATAIDGDAPGTLLRLAPGAEVTLDTRRPGDRFQPPGLGGRSRPLRKWMNSQRLPASLRDRLPLLRVDGRIVAVFGGDLASPAWQHVAASDRHLRTFFCAMRRNPGRNPCRRL